MVERLAVVAEDVAGVAAHVRGYVPRAGLGRTRSWRGIIASVEEGGDDALLMHERRFGGGDRRRCACPARSCDAALDGARPGGPRAGWSSRCANVARGRRGGPGRRTATSSCRRASVVRLREIPVAPRRGLRARRPPAVPVLGRDGRRHRARRRRRGGRRRRARAPGDPRRLRAVRGRRGLPHGRRPGDRRARARDGDDPARRRDRRPGQRCTCRRPSASSRAASASTASPGRPTCSCSPPPAPTRAWSRSTCSRRPSTATDSLVVAVSDDRALLDARRARAAGAVRARARRSRAGRRCSSTPPDLDARARVRRGARARAPRARRARPPRRSPRASRRAGCLFVGAASATAFGDYVAGSNHTLPTDGAARFASGLTVGALPAPHERGPRRRRGRGARARRRPDRRGRGLRRARRIDVRGLRQNR